MSFVLERTCVGKNVLGLKETSIYYIWWRQPGPVLFAYIGGNDI
jgi:hypothetical protein